MLRKDHRNPIADTGTANDLFDTVGHIMKGRPGYGVDLKKLVVDCHILIPKRCAAGGWESCIMKQTNTPVTNAQARDAQTGMHKSEIDTPALLLELAAMEQNLQHMAAFTAAKHVNLRPHVKTYKATPELAHLQMGAGAIGM